MSDVLAGGAAGAAPDPEPSAVAGDSPDTDETDSVEGADDADGKVRSSGKRRRRGTRGGRGRNRTRVGTLPSDSGDGAISDADDEPELPDRPIEGKVQSPEVAERVLVRRPQIGDTRPAPIAPVAPVAPVAPGASEASGAPRAAGVPGADPTKAAKAAPPRKRRRAATTVTGTTARPNSGRAPARAVVTPARVTAPVELDEETLD